MRYLPRALVACGTGFAVSLIAACGGGAGLLSGGQANSLSTQLDQVQAAVNSQNCAAAQNASQAFINAVSNLPNTIDNTLRQNLDQGGSTVRSLAVRACQQATSTTTTTPTTPTATTSTTTTTPTTSTTTTPTTTTQPTTTTETSTTTTGSTTTTSSGGGGLSGGGGNGNGNGNGQ
ncbi:MAG TPA: hypothetical protein VGH24_07865 [Solirubrobacteraceae bacterium]